MSTVHLHFMARFAAIVLLLAPQIAAALELKPFKDDLFAYPGLLETRDNGDWIKVDYRKERDLYQRDDDPERKVKGKYVARGVAWHQSFETIAFADRSVDVFDVRKIGRQAFSVIFVHGRGVDRKLGASDDRFGGNFNRLKNLAYDNGGLYVAPTIKAFDAAGQDNGVRDVAAVIAYLAKSAPGRPIILACASMGTLICKGIARDPQSVAVLGGMILMSGIYDDGFMETPFYTAHLPLFFAHSTDDEVYKATDQQALYDKLHAKGYPTRFVLFNTGSHGTPLRMLDWRDTLDWFLKRT